MTVNDVTMFWKRKGKEGGKQKKKKKTEIVEIPQESRWENLVNFAILSQIFVNFSINK